MAKVERRHREEAALKVRYDEPGDARPQAWMVWVETGEMPGNRAGMWGELERANELAAIIADAEARGHEAGRLAEREDSDAWLTAEIEDLDAQGQGANTANAYGWARSAFRRGEHIGAARKKAPEEMLHLELPKRTHKDNGNMLLGWRICERLGLGEAARYAGVTTTELGEMERGKRPFDLHSVVETIKSEREAARKKAGE